MKTGLILFAHGARDPRWAEPFEEIARRIRSITPEREVALAFLEFMQPDLMGAGTALAAAGCRSVDVLPMFLGAGGHVRRDLPQAIAALRATHPEVLFRLHAAIGEAEPVIAAMTGWAAALADGSA